MLENKGATRMLYQERTYLISCFSCAHTKRFVAFKLLCAPKFYQKSNQNFQTYDKRERGVRWLT